MTLTLNGVPLDTKKISQNMRMALAYGFHLQDFTQTKIGQLLKTSPATVNRLIKEAETLLVEFDAMDPFRRAVTTGSPEHVLQAAEILYGELPSTRHLNLVEKARKCVQNNVHCYGFSDEKSRIMTILDQIRRENAQKKQKKQGFLKNESTLFSFSITKEL